MMPGVTCSSGVTCARWRALAIAHAGTARRRRIGNVARAVQAQQTFSRIRRRRRAPASRQARESFFFVRMFWRPAASATRRVSNGTARV